MRFLTFLFSTGFGLLIMTAGCRSPINAKTWTRYHNAGIRAEEREDFLPAKQEYYRAYWIAQSGNLGPAAEAKALYDWARVTGYLGNYEEAELGFTNTLGVIQRGRGEADKLLSPTLCELARLFHDTQQFTKAVPIFKQAQNVLEQAGAPEMDPMGFAIFLDDYAESLRAAGLSSEATAITERSKAIREAHQGETPKRKPRRYAQSLVNREPTRANPPSSAGIKLLPINTKTKRQTLVGGSKTRNACRHLKSLTQTSAHKHFSCQSNLTNSNHRFSLKNEGNVFKHT
ncbi:tetratricopeptide repeat protein [Pedosphaera parvula]|nr:tetratricopeptide repeat protein [Pedosphaera parvula]